MVFASFFLWTNIWICREPGFYCLENHDSGNGTLNQTKEEFGVPRGPGSRGFLSVLQGARLFCYENHNMATGVEINISQSDGTPNWTLRKPRILEGANSWWGGGQGCPKRVLIGSGYLGVRHRGDCTRERIKQPSKMYVYSNYSFHIHTYVFQKVEKSMILFFSYFLIGKYEIY